MTVDEESKEFLTLLAHRGFLWGPSPEIYNPLAGAFDYGPVGKQLKNKLETTLRRIFSMHEFAEVQCPLIGPERVWEASGHLERFFDHVVECSNEKCKNTYRIDHLLAETGIPEEDYINVKPEDYLAFIKKHEITCPSCGSAFDNVIELKLMITSELGFPKKPYVLRPETATTTYLLFPRLYTFFRRDMPIRVFQMGQAFRNELSPRNLLIRCREFEQCEGQIFITKDMEQKFEAFYQVKHYKLRLWPAGHQEEKDTTVLDISLEEAHEKGILDNPAYTWLLHLGFKIAENLGFPRDTLRLRQHQSHEKAHYANDAWDLEYHSKIFGWTEICGIHDRGNYDLSRHQEFSNKKMKIPIPGSKERVIPEILEIAFGVGRMFLFILEESFMKDGERTILDFPVHLMPTPFAVFPLQRKPPALVQKARKIYNTILNENIDVTYQQRGSIGKRYRRTEEIGIRYALTVDHQTLEDDTLTIRESITMDQKRIKVDQVLDILRGILMGDLDFSTIEEVK
ncbi:glycine--tRNA ligase [Candidatus Bathyarchaeota archaeon]|nr:glycine--tRNA ligase [Candidatus Bathyarchaeota archaeon]